MQCEELEHVLEENSGQQLPGAAQSHLETCSACRTLVNELESIVAAARELPGEVEPPQRVWVSLRAQLESEKIIHPEVAPARFTWQAPWKVFAVRPVMATAALFALIVALVVMRPWSTDNSFDTAVPQVLTDTRHQLVSLEKGTVPPRAEAVSATTVALQDNLKIVNDFIASCERTVTKTPQNDLAREYLSGAYQQKAELLTALQDRNTLGD